MVTKQDLLNPRLYTAHKRIDYSEHLGVAVKEVAARRNLSANSLVLERLLADKEIAQAALKHANQIGDAAHLHSAS